MSKDFDFDFSEFEEFAEHFDSMLSDENFLLDTANEIGNGMLSSLKLNTPVGQYDDTIFFVRGGKLLKFTDTKNSRTGGNLARNWFLKSAQKLGSAYTVEAYNNTEYGPYVNDGHRKADHSGWVEGQFFVEAAMEEVEYNVDPILKARFLDYLKRFGVS